MRPLNTREWLESVHPVSQYYDFAREALAGLEGTDQIVRVQFDLNDALGTVDLDEGEIFGRVTQLSVLEERLHGLLEDAGLIVAGSTPSADEAVSLLRMFLPVED